MNKFIGTAAVLNAAILSASAAQASDGTITINGQINTQTCTVTNGTSGNIVVTLPTVQSLESTAAGTTVAHTGFDIVLANCNATGQVSAFFETGATVDLNSGRLNNMATSSAASGVQVELENADLTPIKAGTSATAQGAQSFAIDSSGAATLHYAAAYYATAATVGAGAVQTSAVYTLAYN